MGARLCCRSVRGRARKRRPPHNRDTGTQPGQRQPFLTRRGVSWSRDLQPSGRVFSRLLSRLAQRSSEIEIGNFLIQSTTRVRVCLCASFQIAPSSVAKPTLTETTDMHQVLDSSSPAAPHQPANESGTMLTNGSNQYIQPDYLSPLPTTVHFFLVKPVAIE